MTLIQFAVGGRFGILLEPTKGTRLGVAYTTPVEHKFRDKAEFDNIGPGLTRLLETSGLLTNDVKMNVNVPQEVLFSVYQEVTDWFAVLGSVNWQEWSDLGSTSVSLGAADTHDITIENKLQNTWNVAGGVQFKFSPDWRTSLGFGYDQSPVALADRGPMLPVDRLLRWAIGFEHDLSEDLTLGFAYEFVDTGKNKIDQERGPLAGRIQGSYDSYLHVLSASANWRF